MREVNKSIHEEEQRLAAEGYDYDGMQEFRRLINLTERASEEEDEYEL